MPGDVYSRELLLAQLFVPGERIELSCLAATGLESVASANSATPACLHSNISLLDFPNEVQSWFKRVFARLPRGGADLTLVCLYVLRRLELTQGLRTLTTD